jgi:hypothetical protein
LVVAAAMVEMLAAQGCLAAPVVVVKALVEIVIIPQGLAHQVRVMLVAMVMGLHLEQKAVEVAEGLEL